MTRRTTHESCSTCPLSSHDEEEVWNVIEGEIEMTLDGTTRVVGAGEAVVVPSKVEHAARATSPCRVIIVDSPVRETVGRVDTS
jgi:mannose-6-phosphate isomerase-like protein (cupin superfamily)